MEEGKNVCSSRLSGNSVALKAGEGARNNTEEHGWLRLIRAELTPPSLSDNTADADRLIKELKKKLGTEYVAADLSLLRTVSATLRKNNYNVHVACFEDRGIWKMIHVFTQDDPAGIYGIALDLGSTTLVLQLVNLMDGSILDEVSFHNPQIRIGSDILTRIHYATARGGLAELQEMVNEQINKTIEQITQKHALKTESIVAMSVAGNTTMTHFFLGLDPYGICREPYIPVTNRPDLIPAAELGLAIHPAAPVLVFPNVGSYFGGDLIAGILSSGITHQEEVCFLVDVGTNAEVVIGNRDWLMACAGAAGPALEGGVADMGMMAGPDVIDKVRIEPETGAFQISTIQGGVEHHPARPGKPVGICGSGLIDLAAQLFLAGMIDLRGKFEPGKCGDRMIDVDGIKHLVVVAAEESGTGEPLTLSQPDLDGLVRSKAAMYTILTTIANTVNIPLSEIKRFYVAGTFGSYINPESAITIGMIPDLPLDVYASLGNTSLKGACMALLNKEAKEEITRIRDQITYLELNVNQEFMNLFSAAKFIPHTDRSLFPSVRRCADTEAHGA